MVVLDARTLVVDLLGIGRDDLAADLAHDVEHAAVRVQSILRILRSVVVDGGIGEVALFELDDLAHQRMRKMIL